MVNYSSYMLDYIDSEFECEKELVHYIEMTKYKIHDYNLDHYVLEVSSILYGIMQQHCIEHDIRYIEKYRGILVSINENLEPNKVVLKYERNDNMTYNSRIWYGEWDVPYNLKKEEKKLPDKVLINKKKKATTLLFDDEAIVVKKSKDDKEDYEKAFLWGYFIKKSGLSKTQASKYIDKIMEENNGKGK